jgi:hypothetical protein
MAAFAAYRRSSTFAIRWCGWAAEIDWDFLAGRLNSVCRVGPGQPPLPTRLVAGLLILKHMHNLSNERCATGGWRTRTSGTFAGKWCPPRGAVRSLIVNALAPAAGEEQIAALLQESLSVAHRSGAIASQDLERVVVDTNVQEKAISYQTDSRGGRNRSPPGNRRAAGSWLSSTRISPAKDKESRTAKIRNQKRKKSAPLAFLRILAQVQIAAINQSLRPISGRLGAD